MKALKGKTPAEKAKINYTIKSWVDVVRTSKPHVEVLSTPAKVDVLSERKTLVRPITNKTYNFERKNAQRRMRKIIDSISKKTPKITEPKPSITPRRVKLI